MKPSTRKYYSITTLVQMCYFRNGNGGLWQGWPPGKRVTNFALPTKSDVANGLKNSLPKSRRDLALESFLTHL